MRYLLILDAALCAMAGTLAMVLGVVVILYSFHTELSARVAIELPKVATLTACFALLAVVLGIAFWSLLRQRAWRWWAQAGAALSLVLGWLFLYRMLAA
jgi:uncharacterized membrane protein HdeD (DUF308 family)